MLFNETELRQLINQYYSLDPNPESPYPAGFLHEKMLPAAVLIPMMMKEDAWHLLFIRRTFQKNDRHGGQVAFPGGRCEATDPSAEHTAKREACEETGIQPKDVRILGRLQDLLTITGYQVTPFVGAIPWPYPLVAQPDEVANIFTIPLKWLADPENREIRRRDLQVKGESVPVIYFKPYSGETLWGASGRITLLLLEALGLSTPEARYG